MKVWLYAPLIGHVVPTLVIGFGFVIPGSPIEGVNTYTIGFLSAVLGFIPVYIAGIAIAKRMNPDLTQTLIVPSEYLEVVVTKR